MRGSTIGDRLHLLNVRCSQTNMRCPSAHLAKFGTMATERPRSRLNSPFFAVIACVFVTKTQRGLHTWLRKTLISRSYFLCLKPRKVQSLSHFRIWEKRLEPRCRSLEKSGAKPPSVDQLLGMSSISMDCLSATDHFPFLPVLFIGGRRSAYLLITLQEALIYSHGQTRNSWLRVGFSFLHALRYRCSFLFRPSLLGFVPSLWTWLVLSLAHPPSSPLYVILVLSLI